MFSPDKRLKVSPRTPYFLRSLRNFMANGFGFNEHRRMIANLQDHFENINYSSIEQELYYRRKAAPVVQRIEQKLTELEADYRELEKCVYDPNS